MCPLGAPLDPMITKMVPQVTKIQPEGLQNDNLEYKKTTISVANQPAAPCIQRGRRQGRSLKIRRTPRRGAAGRDGIATEVLAERRIQGAHPLPPAPRIGSQKKHQNFGQQKKRARAPNWAPSCTPAGTRNRKKPEKTALRSSLGPFPEIASKSFAFLAP